MSLADIRKLEALNYEAMLDYLHEQAEETVSSSGYETSQNLYAKHGVIEDLYAVIDELRLRHERGEYLWT